MSRGYLHYKKSFFKLLFVPQSWNARMKIYFLEPPVKNIVANSRIFDGNGINKKTVLKSVLNRFPDAAASELFPFDSPSSTFHKGLERRFENATRKHKQG